MSALLIECPHCDESLEAPKELQGETVPCPVCKQPVCISAAPGVATVEQLAYLENLFGSSAPAGLSKNQASALVAALAGDQPTTRK